jgi:uncharacterized protein (TIGR04255 family)
VPDAERFEYERNFIQLAVCELRFPTVLEFETECPRDFQKALRKEYPHLEQGAAINILPTGDRQSERRYIFRSMAKDWSVTLRSSAVALETAAYVNFEDFLERLLKVVEKAAPLLDTDFFTRVGLRYVNSLPVEGDPTGWINHDLIKPLIDNVLGEPVKYWQQISGKTDSGRVNINHGLQENEEPEKRSYVLDFDFYRELVKMEELEDRLKSFNRLNFNLFSWAVGSKAIDFLGPAKKKEPRG